MVKKLERIEIAYCRRHHDVQATFVSTHSGDVLLYLYSCSWGCASQRAAQNQNNKVYSGPNITTTGRRGGDCIQIINSTNITIQNSQIGPCSGNGIHPAPMQPTISISTTAISIPRPTPRNVVITTMASL
jgi:hypothetical protein